MPAPVRPSPGIQKHCVFIVFLCFSFEKIIPATFSVFEDAPATFSVLEDAPGSDFFLFISHFTRFYLLATFFGVSRPPLTRASF